jgi:hypothetical protein
LADILTLCTIPDFISNENGKFPDDRTVAVRTFRSSPLFGRLIVQMKYQRCYFIVEIQFGPVMFLKTLI